MDLNLGLSGETRHKSTVAFFFGLTFNFRHNAELTP